MFFENGIRVLLHKQVGAKRISLTLNTTKFYSQMLEQLRIVCNGKDLIWYQNALRLLARIHSKTASNSKMYMVGSKEVVEKNLLYMERMAAPDLRRYAYS